MYLTLDSIRIFQFDVIALIFLKINFIQNDSVAAELNFGVWMQLNSIEVK